MNQEFVRLDPFDGQNYILWAEMVMFLLAVLKLGFDMDPELPPIAVDSTPEARNVPDQKSK